VRPAPSAPHGPGWVAAGAWRCLRDPLALTRLVRWRALAEHAGLARGRLVDVGAGAQPYAPLFRGRVDRIVTVDYPGRAAPPRVDVWGDAQALPLRTASADTVLCVEVLEYLPDPGAALKEFGRVLRSGGRLLLTAPQLRGMSDEPDDYWRFGRPGLDRLARAAGLDDVVIAPCGGAAAAWGQHVSSWAYATLARRRLPVALVRSVCGLLQAPCWLVEQAGAGRGVTLHWLLTARKP
jgi:SAM-dependent methyltransferase